METALTWTKWQTLLEFLPVNIEVFVAYTQAKDGDDDVLYYSVAMMMMVVVMTKKDEGDCENCVCCGDGNGINTKRQ